MAKRSLKEMNKSDEEEETEEEYEEEEEVVERRKRASIRVSREGRAVSSVSSHPLCCQADDCDFDLSCAKRYHRRHKVCVRHAKAAVVLVGGVDQRYCQQCSRFHEISQFDNAKRSCRKRLAGHNECRRKTIPDIQAEDI